MHMAQSYMVLDTTRTSRAYRPECLLKMMTFRVKFIQDSWKLNLEFAIKAAQGYCGTGHTKNTKAVHIHTHLWKPQSLKMHAKGFVSSRSSSVERTPPLLHGSAWFSKQASKPNGLELGRV